MKAVEFLKIGKELLKLLSSFGIRCDDYRHIGLYEDYTRMRDDGEKMDYIICILEEKYKVSESTIRRIIRRFSKDVR